MKKYKLLMAGFAILGIGLFLTLPLYFQFGLIPGLAAIALSAASVAGFLVTLLKSDDYKVKEKERLELEAKTDYEKLSEKYNSKQDVKKLEAKEEKQVSENKEITESELER